jgi:hypothetical protein
VVIRDGSGSQHVQDFTHLFGADLWLQFLSAQQQVHEIVVRQVHQHVHASGLPNGQASIVPIEEAFDEQVVFEQAPATAPPEFAKRPLAQKGVAVCVDQGRVFK